MQQRPSGRRGIGQWRLHAQISSNAIKNGISLEIDNVPYKVIEFLHVKPGKGAAFVRSKLKNSITGGVIEKVRRCASWRTSPSLYADVSR